MSDYIIKTNTDGSTITVGDIQKALMKILKEFDRICQKYSIEYTLGFGSLLGAVRHQGFIPWDDDLDVIIDYENFDRLRQILPDELSDSFYFQCFETDSRYNILIPAMKVRMRNTYIKETNTLLENRCHSGSGLFLDVFVFDKMAPSKRVHFFHRFMSTLLMPPIVLLDNLHFNPRLLKSCMNHYSRWYARHYRESTDIYFTLTWTWDGFKDKRIKQTDMYPPLWVPFEDGIYPIANNFDKVLTVMYSADYMTLPDTDKRYAKHIIDITIDKE